ncbi:hypothetical protein [Novosphingobium sp. B 225]|uniref:hypothetical protein n=1 Tax=Novosphingobium sp. B 225 TaxID=1961849 RepID=UPI000B4B2336|nr:hypothetical protein [Novosphingobium sp. B 225]
MRSLLVTLPMLLAACGSAGEPAAEASGAAVATAPVAASSPTAAPAKPARHELSACPKLVRDDENGLLERKAPLAVPKALAELVAADMNQFAVTTLGGGTGCIDVRWMEAIGTPTLSKDQRFLSFGWNGYEAFGFIVFDRAGKGASFETGDTPVWSASRQHFAAIDLSESGFGGLNAFGVWEVTAGATQELSAQSDGLPSGDWRVDGWQGDSCVAISLVPSERMPSDAGRLARAARDPWYAAAAKGWKLQPGSCPKA